MGGRRGLERDSLNTAGTGENSLPGGRRGGVARDRDALGAADQLGAGRRGPGTDGTSGAWRGGEGDAPAAGRRPGTGQDPLSTGPRGYPRAPGQDGGQAGARRAGAPGGRAEASGPYPAAPAGGRDAYRDRAGAPGRGGSGPGNSGPGGSGEYARPGAASRGREPGADAELGRAADRTGPRRPPEPGDRPAGLHRDGGAYPAASESRGRYADGPAGYDDEDDEDYPSGGGAGGGLLAGLGGSAGEGGRGGRHGSGGGGWGSDEDWDSEEDDDAGSGADGRPPRRRGRSRVAVLVALCVIGIPVLIGAFLIYHVVQSHEHPPDYSGDGTGTVLFQVKPGDSAGTVGPRLVTDGIVASTRAFVLAAESSKNANELEPGFYRMHKHMNAALAWALLLNRSAVVQSTVTIPEGLRVSEILSILAKKSGISASDYAKAIKDTAALGLPSYAKGNPEGYLYPDTYQIQPNMSAADVLKAMVQAYDAEADHANLAAAAAADHLSVAQVMVVASLAQAEGGKDSDFPKIARVIYNRLRIGMKLDLDSTVLFANNSYGILASDAQLDINSPYNTYRNTGLPPGPIDCPGDAAIEAALHPATGNWLYFVTVDPKTKETLFTSSYTQFEQYRNELEQNLAHGG